MTDQATEDRVICLRDVTGQPVWRVVVGARFSGIGISAGRLWRGSRSSKRALQGGRKGRNYVGGDSMAR